MIQSEIIWLKRRFVCEMTIPHTHTVWYKSASELLKWIKAHKHTHAHASDVNRYTNGEGRMREEWVKNFTTSSKNSSQEFRRKNAAVDVSVPCFMIFMNFRQIWFGLRTPPAATTTKSRTERRVWFGFPHNSSEIKFFCTAYNADGK